MCVCVGGGVGRSPWPQNFARAARASRASRASRTAPRGLCGSHREAVWQPQRGCVAATQAASVWKPHRGCEAATQRLLLCHNSTLWLLRSHNSCVGCIQKLYAVYTRYITRPESAGKHRFWHERGREATIRAETLCGESCAPQDASRMPRLPKNLNIRQKTGGVGDFRAPGPPGPYFPVDAMRCRDARSAFYACFVRNPGMQGILSSMASARQMSW